MKQSFARTFVIISLVLSSISFILSMIAFYLPNWKHIQVRSSIIPLEFNQMDPLIRGEIEKYSDMLYRQDEIHSFGLITHCIVGRECGRNLLPSFDETDYKLCHSIKYHHQCIFSESLALTRNCHCKKPSYISYTYILLIIILSLEVLFIFVNFLRLYHCYCSYLNDIHLRLISIISTLFSSIFLIIILIQQRNNRLIEPLEFFEVMRKYYSRVQIYAFSNDLELVIKQIENDLDIRLGASYICMIFILIFTIISFLTSSTVEIKILPISDEDESKNEQNHILLLSSPPPIERFVPSEQIRYTRQTKV